MGTIAPPPAPTLEPPAAIPDSEIVIEEATQPPLSTQASTPPTLDFTGPGLFGPETGLGKLIIPSILHLVNPFSLAPLGTLQTHLEFTLRERWEES